MPDGACEDAEIQQWNDNIRGQLDRLPVSEVVLPDREGMLAKLAPRPFALKDPRFSTTYPVWKPLLPDDCACLITFRDPVSFAESVQRLAAEITEIKDTLEQSLVAWRWTYEGIFAMDNGSFRYIHYQTLMDGSIFPYLERLLGYPIVRGFVRPELLHPQEHPCPAELRGLYGKLLHKMVRPARLPLATSSSEDCGSGI